MHFTGAEKYVKILTKLKEETLLRIKRRYRASLAPTLKRLINKVLY